MTRISLLSRSFAAAVVMAVCSMFVCIPVSQAQSSSDRSGFSEIINPEIPLSVEFAGKTVDLDRTDMYERFDRELTSMAYTHGNTLLTIKRANRYFPVMAPILKQAGIPADIIYISCIESYLNPRAYSPAKAAGVWQFVPATAKQYGLEVNDEVDERYDVEKATRAAAKYLRDAYAKYGNWESAAASYNAGHGRITTELERQGVSSAYDLYLNDETSRYMFRLLAMKTIMKQPGAFGFRLNPKQLYQPVEYTVETVTGPVEDWVQWAKDHGITYAQLRDVNPWIRARKLTNKTGKTYQVRIPRQSSLYRSRQQKSVIYNPAWTQKPSK